MIGNEEPELQNVAAMDARLSRLEYALDAMRHAQNLTLGGVAGVGAAVLAVGGIVVALMIYGFTRTDQLSDRIAAVPGQIATENRDIVKTLSDAITATKQQAPQVLLVPGPQLTPTTAPTSATPSQPDLKNADLVLSVAFQPEATIPDDEALTAVASIVPKVRGLPTIVVAANSAVGPALASMRAIGVANYLVEKGYRGRIEITTTDLVRANSVGIFAVNKS